MTDSEFLKWLVERLIFVYGENTNTDFVIRLRDLAWSLDEKDYVNRSSEEERHPRDNSNYKTIEQDPGYTVVFDDEHKAIVKDECAQEIPENAPLPLEVVDESTPAQHNEAAYWK